MLEHSLFLINGLDCVGMEPVNHRITDCLPYYESGRESPFDLLKKPHGLGLGAEIPDCHPEERIGICPIGRNAGNIMKRSKAASESFLEVCLLSLNIRTLNPVEVLEELAATWDSKAFRMR